MNPIDLRSDTVTQPTKAMREAMYKAELGDDVFGEDPAVNRLEQMAADKLGKQAALFVASGTMANLVALLTLCQRGDEVILGNLSHTFLFEQGGISALGGITPWPLPNQADGTLVLEQIQEAIRGENIHFPRSRVICLENTHNMCDGMPLTIDYIKKVVQLAHSHGLKMHVDGARIFNAASALKTDVKELVKEVDSVMFCLSKGLCAPVGLLLCGNTDFIKQARRTRKIVGGGMRQAGVIAAAGIVALEQMTERLEHDHIHAKMLAAGLSQIAGLEVFPVKTNIVYFNTTTDLQKTQEQIVKELAEQGVLLLGRINGRFRAVTHYWISKDDIEKTIQVMREVFKMY